MLTEGDKKSNMKEILDERVPRFSPPSPKPKKNKVMNKKLLFSLNKSDFEFQAMRAGGPGGQHQNKTSSAIRVKHIPSGASAVSREHKSQLQNKRSAFIKLVNNEKFRLWIRLESARIITGKSIEERLDEMMSDDNLKIEVRENNRWINQNY